MNNDNLRGVHSTLQKEGYTPPEYDQFAKDMEDDNNLQGVWKTLKKEGYTPPEYEQFKKDMGFGEQPKEQTNEQLSQAAQQPQQQPQTDYEQASTLSAADLARAANKIDGKPEPDGWRNEDVVIDVDKNGQDVTMKRGDMHDKLYKVFSDAMSNAQPGGRSAYAQAFDAADQIAGVGLGTSTKMGLVNRVNMEYAKKQAQQTVASIISKLPERTADPMGELQRAYYDKDIQNQLYNVANTMGNNYDEVVNKLVKPQLIEAMKVKYGGTDNDWQGVRGLFSNWEHVNDRWEREHINSLLGDYFLDDINKALDAGNAAKERVEANALNKLQGMNEQERATSDIGILVNAIKGGNQAADPDAILQRLLNTLGESATTAILQDPQTFEDVWKRAAAKRMDINDYIAKYVAPELQSALTSRFEQEAVKRALPKDTFDYIMKGLTEDNVAAMIANKFFRTEGQNRIASMADMMTEEGKNPNVTPGLLAEGARLASGMAADFWLWGGWGKIGNKVAQKMLSRRLTNLTMEKGLSEAAAREVMAWEAKHSLKGRALQQVMQHIPQSVVMGTGASTTSGVVRGIKDNESAGDILTNAFREIPGHVLTFGAFGGMSALTNSVTANWKGWKKLLGKLMGYEGSALTLYGTGEMSKALNGQEAFERIPKGLLKAQIDQLAMHFASNPGKSIKGLLSAMRHPVSWIKTSDASREKTVLTDKDVSYLTDSEDGKRLMDALANIKPKTSTEAVKDNTALGSYGTEETAASLSEWLNNKDIPQDTKQRVGSLLGFIVPRTLETGSDITVTDDGTIMLKTRDQDGNCVREIPFESQADATQWQSDNQKRFELNDMSELWNGTTKERRMAAVVKMMDETGLQKPADIKAIFEGKADEAQTQALYNALKDVAVRVDEPNAPRFYEQGRQLTVDERHDASLKEQRAFRLIEQQGADFATDVLAGRDNPDVSLPQLEEKYGPVKTKMAVIYYNNYAKTKGMMDEIGQQVDNTVERANDSVRQNSHPSGQVISVTDGVSNYYLTGGDVEIAPDGSLHADRRESIVLRDAETGDLKMDTTDNFKVVSVYNAEDLMRDNEQTLRSQVEQKEMDTVNYAPGTPEDATNGDIYIGADGQRYMAVKNGDTGEWMKVAIDEEGKPAGNPQPFDINEYRAAKSSEIDAAEYPDEIVNDVDVPVTSEETEKVPLEGRGLDYTQLVSDDTNTVTELTLDDGSKVWLKNGDPNNKLGAVSVWYVDDADGQLKEGRIKSSVIAEVGEPMSPEKLMKASAPQSPVVEKPVAEEEQPAEIASAPAIPTDEKGQPIWEDAKPEDTLSVFVEKYGEEKANDMFARLADTSKKAYQKLEEKGAPDTTDANELMAYEDALAEAKRKADYWQSLVKPAEEKPVVEKPAAGQPVNEVTANQQVSVTKPAGIRNQSVKDSKPVAPKKVAKPKTPALSAEEKVAAATVKNNIGKTFEFNGADGSRTEMIIEKQGNDGRVTVMQQLYDTQGQPVGEAKRVIYNTRDVGNGIVKGQIKPVLDTEGKLREAFKGKVAMQNIIDVLSDEERQKMLQTYQSGDKVAFDTLLHDFRDAHHEDLILRSRDKRNEKIDQILNSTASREDKLRQLRQLYDGDIVEGTLSNDALHPSSLEEWVSELNSRVPKKGEGPLAYFSYDKDGTKVVGMQDETGYGTKSAGDTKGFAPWLAPKGKGISLQKYAELLHEQLPEGLKEQYSDQDVRNAVLDVFGGAERPSDIPTMIIRRGIIQAEEAMRRMEEQWIEGGPSFQKKPKEFAARLKSAVDMVNTEPTEAQKAKGNYRKGHVSFGGYDYTIENPAGSVRRGTDANGKQWEQKMNNTYGYILGKYGKDGDHLDMFINDAADLDNWDGTVYVVDQVNKDGSFDEHKVMYGFDSLEDARKAYLSNYEEGWQGLGNITGVPKATFDKWLDSSKRKMIPFAEHSLSKKGRSDIQGLEDYSEDEIKKYVREYVQEQIANSGADAEIVDMKIIGSRVNGDADKDSDLDVLVEYKGKEREDGMFNMLNNADEPLVINGIKVDINPITRGKSGSIDEFMKRNADYQKEQKPKPVKLGSEEDKILRDALNEEVKNTGIPVVTKQAEAQKVLDEYNDRVKLMGSTTRNRQNEIGSAFDGKELTNEQRTVVDAFSGKTERVALSVKDKNNKNRNILFRQGNENKAGVKHSIFRHYSTDANGYTADEVLMIPDVISNGERKQDAGNRVSYKYEKDGVVYTVTTEVKGKDEVFTNFYTNRKPSVAEQGTSNTENRHVQPQQPVLDAKVQQNTETSKDSEQKVKFSKVEDKKTLDELNNGPTVKRYRAMQLIDGKLYPPMSAKVNGEMREPTEIGVWEQSEERPDLIDKNGKFKLNKGQKGQSGVPAAYNPYFHTSTSGLNDQFTSAYKRPELVVVEVEIPESELTSGYKAEGAKDAVGDTDWHSGPVNGNLPEDRKRTVTLSRYAKVNRIVPDSEVADMIAKQLEGTNAEVPYNVVTPQLRKELEQRGVKISSTPSGTVTEDINGNPINKGPRYQKVDKPVFYSNAAKAVEGVKQEKATPEQWRAMIEKNGGLKAGEDKWLGLSDWLKSQDKKSLTKQEVLDYIRQNQIEIEDVNYMEDMPNYAKEQLDAFNEEFSDLIFEGEEATNSIFTSDWVEWAYEQMVDRYGEDFRLAFDIGEGTGTNSRLTPSTDMGDNISEAAKYYLGIDASNEKPIYERRLDYTTEGLNNKREIALVVPSTEPYNQSDQLHFGDAGDGRAVAWVRFGETTDADGNRVLVIDEIQSKRHQDGREKGYVDDEKVKAYNDWIDNKAKEFGVERYQVEPRLTDEEYLEMKRLQEAADGIPDAPFEKNWHELAMKRMIRYAAENGYDKVAWTTGTQQAERYNIGDKIEKVTVTVTDDGRRLVSLYFRNNDGNYEDFHQMNVNDEGKILSGDFAGNTLSDVVGKELAVKLLAAKDGEKLSGENLHVGGEGMKGFYDQMLPRFMDKYTKKWETKTSQIELPELEPSARKMWAVDVTPEMKQSVMEGQPMFFKTPDGEAYGFTMDGKIYVDPEIATSETPIHEYTHLWADMKRKTSPDEWNDIKKVLLADELIKPIIDKVRDEYPELVGNEDSFAEEVLTQYSGKRGSERLRQIAAEIAQEEGGGVFGKAKAVAAVNRLRQILNEFWSGVAKMMGWKYTSAADIADKALHDLLSGVNPNEEIAKSKKKAMPRADQLKQRQLDIILKENPADDVNMPGHTWIRSIDDVKTFAEAVAEDGYAETEGVAPDFTAKMVKDALNHGIVTVYSSKPIEDGIFVTPSKMEAQNYAGDGKVYSKQVPLTDVAWIDPAQGQYVKVSDNIKSQKINYSSDEEKERTKTIFDATKKLFGVTNDIREAGYVLPDGTMPDFSGRHQMDEGSDTSFLRGRRSVDHREVQSIAYERDGNTETGIETDMPDFIRRGAIRIDNNGGTINLATKPTDKQREILRKLVANNDGEVQVDFGDGWDSDHYVEYDSAKPSRVLADIDRYFDEGIKPQGDYPDYQKAKNVELPRAKNIDLPKKEIEELYTEGLTANDSINMQDRVRNMSPKELVEQYKRLNDSMLDKDGLNIDEQEQKFRNEYFSKHGLEGFGKASADFTKKMADKYTYNKMALRWEILDRIKDLGLEAYVDKDLENMVDPKDLEGMKTAEFVRMAIDNHPKFQLVGKKGAEKADKEEGTTVRQDNLKAAEEMEKAGKDVRAIKLATNWERGKDGQWRYETLDADADVLSPLDNEYKIQDLKLREMDKKQDDLQRRYEQLDARIPSRLDSRYTKEQKEKYQQMRKERDNVWKEYLKASSDYNKYKENIRKDGVSTSLGNLLGYDNELFKYYPDIKGMQVLFSNSMNPGTAGSTDGETIEINANEAHRFGDRELDNENVYGTLLHEVQHVIQEKEGFAPGGSPYTATTEEGMEAIIHKKEMERSQILREIDMTHKWLASDKDLNDAAQLDGKTVEDERKSLNENLDELASRYDTLTAQIDGIYNHKTVSMSDAKDLYHNLAGEVEARNATARMNMSDTERRNRPAGSTEDVARDKQVVITPDERRERLMNDVDEATAFVTGRSVEDVRNERLQREKENAVRNDERPANPMEENFVKFQKVRKPTPHEMRDTLEKQADARRTDVAVRKAAEAGIKAPSEQEYMRQADNEFFRLEKEWHEKYDGTEYPPPPPDRWMMQADAQRRYREARNKYEQDIEQYKPVKDEQLSREDVIAEREAQSKTPGQKLANRLQAIMASEQDPETAADSVHQAVIDRRKTISEMSSSDAIYINEIGNKIKQVAKELSEDGNKISANDIQDAIPYIIEAPMRRNDIARNINQELQAKDSPVYITGDDLKFAEKEIDAMRNEAKQLLEVNKAMEEEGRTQMTVEEQALNGRVRSLADDVAQMLNARYYRGNNPVTADDVIASLDQFVREIVPEGLKVDEDTNELIPIISGIKDWYNIAYDWLLESGMKREDVGYFKDYVNHVWDKEKSNPEAYEEYVVNRQPTKSRNMQKREVRTLMDGLELGLVPEFSKIGDLMADYSKTNILAWANRKMLNDLSSLDVIERNDEGEEIGRYNLLSSVEPNMLDKEKYSYFDIPGVGMTWIYKPAAKDFALVFESYNAGKPMQVYDTLASLAKKIELSWSGFHAGALSEVYAVQNGIEFGPAKTAKYFYKYLINDCLKTGESPAYANPDLFQHAAKHLVKLGATDDYSAEAVQNVSQQLRDMLLTAQKELWKKGALGKSAAAVVAPLEVISEALKFINEGSDKLLWTWLHDGLKLATFKMREERTIERLNNKYGDAVGSKEYQEELDKELDRDGQYVNDMFGGQHWEIINISPKTLRNMRRFLLSPDWLISTQRHFLGAFGYGDIYSHSRLKDFRRFASMVRNGDGDPNSLPGLYAGILGRGLKAVGIDNKAADMPINASRLQRARSSLLCYVLGVGLGYQFVNNALNAIMRKMDEEAELEKERTIDGYTSFYRKAYPDGMKWFDRNNMYNPMKMFGLFGDYGMEGNALGKKTHVFAGHYDNGAEIYLRTGKQFKEFPDFWENEKGELEFPKPLIKRLMGKSNPNIRFLYNFLNYYNRWDKTKDDEDLEAKFKKFSENKTFLGTSVGLYKLAENFKPFWVPSQEGKEWVWTDTFFPSSKGFTPYKARTYFGEFIKAGDREGIKQTYMACAQNGLTDAQIDDAFTAALKAIESDQRNSRYDQPKMLQDAVDAFDNAQKFDERRMAKKDIDKIMNGELHPEVTGEDILERFDEYEGKDTDKKVKAAKSEAYLNLCTSADVVEDARFRSAWKQLKAYHDELKEMEQEGAFKQDIDNYKKQYRNELKAYDEINKRKNMIQNGERFEGFVFNKGKKQLGEGTSAEEISKANEAIMNNIRKWRKEALEIAGALPGYGKNPQK